MGRVASVTWEDHLPTRPRGTTSSPDRSHADVARLLGGGPASPAAVVALQRSIGNRATAQLLVPGPQGWTASRTAAAPAVVQPRPRRKKGGSSQGGTGPQKGGTTPPTGKTIRVPIREQTVKQTPEALYQAREERGETVGNVAGGVLDVWEGLEGALDTQKDVTSRTGSGLKVLGGGTVLTTTTMKALERGGETIGDVGGTINEACGLIGAALEAYTAVRNAVQQGLRAVAWEAGKNISGIVAGALKTLDSYKKAMGDGDFQKRIGEGTIPTVSMVAGAVKVLLKVKELLDIQRNRALLADKLTKSLTTDLSEGTSHLVSILDSRWYKGALEIVSTAAEFVGEWMKWGSMGIGWLTGSLVGAGSKLIPLGAKLFNGLWQWGIDYDITWLGTKKSVDIVASNEKLAKLIVARHSQPYGKLLCNALGIDPATATNVDDVMGALAV